MRAKARAHVVSCDARKLREGRSSQMHIRLTFGEPADITDPGVDATVVEFPFSAQIVGTTFKDEMTQHSFSVSISRTLESVWGFGRSVEDQSALTNTLFQFAKKKIVEAVRDDADLNELERVALTTENATRSNPYRGSRLQSPKDSILTIELPPEAATRQQLIDAFMKLEMLGITLTWTKSGLFMGTKQSVDPRTLSDVAQTEILSLENALNGHPGWKQIRLKADELGFDLELKTISSDGVLSIVPVDRRASVAEKMRPMALQL